MVTDSILQDARVDELVLRVCGAGRDHPMVRLRYGKCTVGSGPRCTLRLAAEGVHSLHCLIVRGEHTTVVRSWAPGTLLNGHEFTDAELAVGDRLGIGPTEIEVLDAAAVGQALQREASQHAHQEKERALHALKAELDARQAELDAHEAELNARQIRLDDQYQALAQQRSKIRFEQAPEAAFGPDENDAADSEPGEDESIDEYMHELLNRVHGVGNDPTRPETLQPAPAMPEKLLDLSAMRELANFSAREAIDSYAQRMLSKSMRGKLAVVAISLLAGAILIGLWWTHQAGHAALYAAATAFLVAAFWAIHGTVLAGRLITGVPGKKAAPADG